MQALQAAIDELVRPESFRDSRVAINDAEDIVSGLNEPGPILPSAIKLDLLMELTKKVGASGLPPEARRQIFSETQTALGRIQPNSVRESELQEYLFKVLRSS